MLFRSPQAAAPAVAPVTAAPIADRAAPRAATMPLDINRVSEHWDEIVEAVRRSGRAVVASALAEAAPMAVTGTGVVTIEVTGEALVQALENGALVQGVIQGKVKGGLTVMINGIRAFLPGSLVDLRPVKDTTPFEGKQTEFKVIKLDRKRNNVVLSRRAVIEASMGEERAKLMENLKEGSIVHGVVKNITEYGAFVDLGGIDGLLHITEIGRAHV